MPLKMTVKLCDVMYPCGVLPTSSPGLHKLGLVVVVLLVVKVVLYRHPQPKIGAS